MLRIILTVIGLLLLVWLVFPVAVIIYQSLYYKMASQGGGTQEVLALYAALFLNDEWYSALLTSLAISGSSTIMGTFLAFLVVVSIKMRPTPIPLLSNYLSLLLAPMLIPAIVLGIALSRTLRIAGISGNIPVLALAHVIYTFPLVLTALFVALRNIPGEVLEASLTSGASTRTTLFRILIPLLSRGALVGMVIAFFFSFDELVVTQFVASPRVLSLSLKLWAGLRYYIDPVVFAVGGLTALSGSIGLLALLRPR